MARAYSVEKTRRNNGERQAATRKKVSVTAMREVAYRHHVGEDPEMTCANRTDFDDRQEKLGDDVDAMLDVIDVALGECALGGGGDDHDPEILFMPELLVAADIVAT